MFLVSQRHAIRPCDDHYSKLTLCLLGVKIKVKSNLLKQLTYYLYVIFLDIIYTPSHSLLCILLVYYFTCGLF